MKTLLTYLLIITSTLTSTLHAAGLQLGKELIITRFKNDPRFIARILTTSPNGASYFSLKECEKRDLVIEGKTATIDFTQCRSIGQSFYKVEDIVKAREIVNGQIIGSVDSTTAPLKKANLHMIAGVLLAANWGLIYASDNSGVRGMKTVNAIYEKAITAGFKTFGRPTPSHRSMMIAKGLLAGGSAMLAVSEVFRAIDAKEDAATGLGTAIQPYMTKSGASTSLGLSLFLDMGEDTILYPDAKTTMIETIQRLEELKLIKGETL